MNYFITARSLLRKNIKKYFPFVISCIISLTLYFMYTTLVYNNEILIITKSNVAVILLRVSIVLIIGILSFFAVYAYSSYIKQRSKEFKVMMLIGLTKKELVSLLFFEDLFLTLICFSISILLGTIFSKFFFIIIINYLGFSKIKFSIGLINYVSTVRFLIILLFIVAARTMVLLKGVNNKSKFLKRKCSNRVIFSSKNNILFVLIIISIPLIYAEKKTESTFNLSVWITCIIILYVLVFYFTKFCSYLFKVKKSFYSTNFLLIKEIVKNIEKDSAFIFLLSYFSFLFITYNWFCRAAIIYTKGITFSELKIIRFTTLFTNILFFAISSSIIYFKSQIDEEDFKAYLQKLYLIGITKEEIQLIAKNRLMSMFFTPCTLCTIVSIIFVAAAGLDLQLTIYTFTILIASYGFYMYGYLKAKINYIELIVTS